VLAKIREVWVRNEEKSSVSQYASPRAAKPPVLPHPLPDAELPNAFLGRPVTKSSRKGFRLLGFLVYSVPSYSTAKGGSWQSPYRASTSFMASRPLKSNTRSFISLKNFSGAPELNLLQTPLVVKASKDLATSTPLSGFCGFKPQSILKSSLCTMPLATPSASPGQSVTPLLRVKKTKVSFSEENSNAKQT
ncbi:ELYS protein, partial [Indicator maculatus]|nr:ELYS protein [Indicator maculatus]